MNSNFRNLTDRYCKKNDKRIRSFERFLKKNRLDNALVVTESSEVVDLYANAIVNMDIGRMDIIRQQVCYHLSQGFICFGSVFIKASNIAIIWTRFCYMMAGWFNYMGDYLFKVGHRRL